MKKLEGNLAQLRQRLDQLSVKHTAAQSELEAATAARQANLIQGDLEDAKAATVLQQRVDTAQSALRGLDDAIMALSAQLADAERALTDEQQRAARKAASEALARDVEIIESKLTPWLEGTRELATLVDKHSHLRAEAGAIARFLLNAAGEVDVAMGVTMADLQRAVKAIEDGREAIPKPLAPVLKVVPPAPPPTERYYVLQPGMWTDHDGTLHFAQRHTIASLPAQAAANAIKTGGVCSLDDRRVQEFKKRFGKFGPPTLQPPERHICWNWDDGSPPSGDPGLMVHHKFHQSSPFQPLDRGPPRAMIVPVTPAVATRSEDSEDR